MAALPSAEDSARVILRIYVSHFNRRPGHVLSLNNFLCTIDKYDLRPEDFNNGLRFAINKGWLSLESESSYKLTESGFSEA